MYIPPHFEMHELDAVQSAMELCGLAHFVTWAGGKLRATPLPLFLVRDEGEFGTLYGHFAKANGQWSAPMEGEALAIFPAADAYITPSWYATKAETGKVVPTWNYEVVHAYGVPQFFQDEAQLLDVVTRLTEQHEGGRAAPWQVSDAPADFVKSQLRGIVGFRMRISRLEGKKKMSQNRTAADREGVEAGLRAEGQMDLARRVAERK
jgi:transcriptional regulator